MNGIQFGGLLYVDTTHLSGVILIMEHLRHTYKFFTFGRHKHNSANIHLAMR